MNKSFLPTIAVLIVTALAIAGMVQYTRSHNGSNEPTFLFTEDKAPGWWTSGNSNQQSVAGDNYKGDEPRDKLPSADMAVHHVTAEKTAQEDGCFVLFSYYTYQLDDVAGAYKAYENKKTELADDATLKPLETSEHALVTHEGDVSFELRQYDLIMPGIDILSGYSVGFANTDNGHIRVEGVCQAADDLPLTLPVISAVTLQK